MESMLWLREMRPMRPRSALSSRCRPSAISSAWLGCLDRLPLLARVSVPSGPDSMYEEGRLQGKPAAAKGWSPTDLELYLPSS